MESKKSCDLNLVGIEETEEYKEFIKNLELAEQEGKLPYKCLHCDFTTSMLTGVFHHLAEDCAQLTICNMCGKKFPNADHFQQHGFECLLEGNYEGREIDDTNIMKFISDVKHIPLEELNMLVKIYNRTLPDASP